MVCSLINIIYKSLTFFFLSRDETEALSMQVGNWSRWLTDMFGMDTDDSPKEDEDFTEDDDGQDGVGEPKSFILLNSFSDLLMLPKDMLMDRSIRQEVNFIIKANLHLEFIMFVFSVELKE